MINPFDFINHLVITILQIIIFRCIRRFKVYIKAWDNFCEGVTVYSSKKNSITGVSRRQHTSESSTREGGSGIKRQSTLTLYPKGHILWRRRQMETKDIILKRKLVDKNV